MGITIAETARHAAAVMRNFDFFGAHRWPESPACTGIIATAALGHKDEAIE
jgi:hypothetical protein